jgi:peptidoglycan/LPS O-acetylase OafA/YrhL
MASAVIFDHAFPLGGWGVAPFLAHTRNQQSLGGLAVLGFLGISGYLVTKSAMGSDIMQFMWRRVLRIFPAFWTVLLVGAFVVGPAIWLAGGRPLTTYFGFGDGSPVAYLYRNFALWIGQFGIRDVFEGTTPFGGSINGSIWTLVYEWMCYLMLAGLLVIGVLSRAKIIIPIVAGFFFLMQLVYVISAPAAAIAIPFFADPWRLNFGYIFFIGATLAVYSDVIPFDHRFGAFAGIASLALLRYGGFNTVGYLLFAYFVLYAAAALPRITHRIGAKNDYSYGVYLYGWVVEQILAFLGVYRWGYFPFALLTLVGAFGCAWLSWHAVEKHALKLKDWGPGRGIRRWLEVLRARTRSTDPEPVAERG